MKLKRSAELISQDEIEHTEQSPSTAITFERPCTPTPYAQRQEERSKRCKEDNELERPYVASNSAAASPTVPQMLFTRINKGITDSPRKPQEKQTALWHLTLPRFARLAGPRRTGISNIEEFESPLFVYPEEHQLFRDHIRSSSRSSNHSANKRYEQRGLRRSLVMDITRRPSHMHNRTSLPVYTHNGMSPILTQVAKRSENPFPSPPSLEESHTHARQANPYGGQQGPTVLNIIKRRLVAVLRKDSIVLWAAATSALVCLLGSCSGITIAIENSVSYHRASGGIIAFCIITTALTAVFIYLTLALYRRWKKVKSKAIEKRDEEWVELTSQQLRHLPVSMEDEVAHRSAVQKASPGVQAAAWEKLYQDQDRMLAYVKHLEESLGAAQVQQPSNISDAIDHHDVTANASTIGLARSTSLFEIDHPRHSQRTSLGANEEVFFNASETPLINSDYNGLENLSPTRTSVPDCDKKVEAERDKMATSDDINLELPQSLTCGTINSIIGGYLGDEQASSPTTYSPLEHALVTIRETEPIYTTPPRVITEPGSPASREGDRFASFITGDTWSPRR